MFYIKFSFLSLLYILDNTAVRLKIKIVVVLFHYHAFIFVSTDFMSTDTAGVCKHIMHCVIVKPSWWAQKAEV